MRSIVPLFLSSLLTFGQPAVAQVRFDRIHSLDREELIRVETRGRSLRIGRLLAVTADTVYLRSNRGGGAIPLNAIRQLSVRRTATREGAVVGGIVGGAVGAALLSWLSVGFCDGAECAVSGRAALAGLFGGAVGGAISGAVFGAMGGRWQRRFP